MSDYEKMLRVLSTSGKSEMERADNLIKGMCRLINDLLEYRYCLDHYKLDGKSTVVIDSIAKIKNSTALVVSEMDIYMDQMDITNKVKQKASDRIKRLADKVQKNVL